MGLKKTRALTRAHLHTPFNLIGASLLLCAAGNEITDSLLKSSAKASILRSALDKLLYYNKYNPKSDRIGRIIQLFHANWINNKDEWKNKLIYLNEMYTTVNKIFHGELNKILFYEYALSDFYYDIEDNSTTDIKCKSYLIDNIKEHIQSDLSVTNNEFSIINENISLKSLKINLDSDNEVDIFENDKDELEKLADTTLQTLSQFISISNSQTYKLNDTFPLKSNFLNNQIGVTVLSDDHINSDVLIKNSNTGIYDINNISIGKNINSSNSFNNIENNPTNIENLLESKPVNNFEPSDTESSYSSSDNFQIKMQKLKKPIHNTDTKSNKNWNETKHEIKIDNDTWNSLVFDKKKNKLRKSDYMDVIREAFRTFYPCVINSKDGKVFDNSIRIYTYKCAHENCQRRYMFTHNRKFEKINDEVREISNTKIFKILYQGGNVIHDKPLTNQLKGFNRIRVRNILKSKYASDYQKEVRKNTCLILKTNGNLADYKSIEVLNQVRCEALALQDKNPDMIEDLRKRMMEEKQTGNITLHNLTIMHNFVVYSFAKSQVEVLKKVVAQSEIEDRELRVSIDATGGVSNIPKDCEGVVYLYAVVINLKNVDLRTGMNFPLIEMLTNSHTGYNIRLFLQFLRNEVEKVPGMDWPIFKHATTDFSKAMLNGLCLAWNNIKLIEYINLAHDWLNDSNLDQMESLVIIHICYSHLIKNFLRVLKKHFKNNEKSTIYTILNVLKYIMNESNYDKIKIGWECLSKILQEPNHEKCKLLLITLDNILSNSSFANTENIESEEDNLEFKMYEPLWDSLEHSTLYSKSKFYKEFEIITKTHDVGSEKITNTFYKPKLVQELLKNFITYLPLWAPIVKYTKNIADPDHFTNACIESHFGEIKHECEKKAVDIGKLPIIPGRFLKFTRDLIEEKAYEFINEFPKVNFTNRKYKKALKEDQEKWSKRRKRLSCKHFSKARVEKKKTPLRVVKGNVIIRGTAESESTDTGDDEDVNNTKFSNGLIKNPCHYHKQIIVGGKKINYVVAKFKNINMKSESYNTLTNNSWVENFLIDTYLDLKYSTSDVQIQPFAFGSLLFLGNLSDLEIEAMAKNVVLHKSIIIFPIFDNNHFFVIIINCTEKTFIIADSSKEPNKFKNTYINKYNNMYNNFEMFLCFYNSENDINFKVDYAKDFFAKCNKQNDKFSCAIFMLIHIDQYISNKMITVDEKINLRDKRLECQSLLLRKSDPMHDNCLLCGLDVHLEGDSVRCSTCHRYIHGHELNISVIKTIDVKKKFFCPLCI